MSYRQDSQYPRPPPPVPPRPPYRDPQQPDQYAQAQNGGYAPQYPQSHQYPGQPIYGQNQTSGAVQQPQNTSYGAGYGTQQYAQPTASYNPQHYSPQPAQGPIPQYNPQAYASTTSMPNPSHYAPAAFHSPDPQAAAQATSGPLGDPYAYGFDSYSPQPAQHTSASHSPAQSRLSPQQPIHSPQSPHSQFSSQLHHSPPPTHGYAPPPQSTQPAYTQSTYSSGLHQGHAQNYASISPALPGLTDETWMPSPPNYYVNDTRPSPASLQHTTSHGSLPSPPGSTPGPTPPAHSHIPSRSNTLDRHPQSRPLPGPPAADSASDYFDRGSSSLSREEEEDLTQEELFTQVENAVLNAGRDGWNPSASVTPAGVRAPNRSPSTLGANSPGHSGGAYNGHSSPRPASRPAFGIQLSDDSDAEAAAGLEAMRMDDERQAAEDARRRSSVSTRLSSYDSQRTTQQLPPHPSRLGVASDSDEHYHGVDMTMYGGGYAVQMSYGGGPNQLAVAGEVNGDGHGQPISSQHSSMRRSHASQSSRGDPAFTPGSMHDFSPYNLPARVDAGGTGGNYEPTADGRRPSFDEGDEYTFNESQPPLRFPDEPPDIFYHPAPSVHRPLPPPPLDTLALPYPVDGRPPPAYAPDEYSIDAQGRWVPRSASVISHSNTPQVPQPLRSKTDAEERKRQLNRISGYSSTFDTPASASAIALDLPSLAAKPFLPSKLGALDFKKCTEPWALSAILEWLITVVVPDQTTELKEAAVKEALVNLFTNKVPTMNIADAEVLSVLVVHDMYIAGTLQTTEEWVRLVPGPMSGVIFQLTGTGCYSPTVHDHIVPGRCYSHHCQRTLKKVNLSTHPVRTTEAWAEFYSLKKEDIEGKEKKEIERQYVLHEIVQTEEIFLEQLNVLQVVYCDPITKTEPSVISPKRKEKFIKDVFGRLDAVKQANEDHLLPQLKYRQQEQGPWIVGFSDIFRQWIRKAKAAYIDYAGAFPGATFMVRQEMERNIQFAHFLDRARVDSRSHKLGWDTYLKAPITRLQRYTLLLQVVLRNMKVESEEKTNLQVAYDEVKAVTLECDTRVAEMQRKVDLADLSTKLVLRPGMQNAVELNLNHLGRELVHRGDLQRMGGNRFTWLDSHAILFDHYLVLSKTVAQRADQGGRLEKYDVSRLPIPMDLLLLESTNDPAVQKSSYMKGISTVTAVTGRTVSPNDAAALTKTPSTSSVPNLQHVNTGSSQASLHTVTALENKDSEKILYPFRVRHLGRETYTLFAYSEKARREWCNKIIEAKTKHAAALFAQSAEPFRLRVMADAAFVYDGFSAIASKSSILIKNTPVDRAIKEVAHRFKDTGRPGPICRARVNCATSFTTPYPGKQMVAVGTDYGVYFSPLENPRGWTKAITMSRVTQLAVLEEFNLFILISDKSLIAYHLDVVCASDRSGPAPPNDSVRKAPQKLSGSKDVGFFVIGRMKDRTLVFYKKRENLTSTFKVLEPVFQKSTEKKRGMFKRGTTELFRDYDEFYIPTECSGINLFHSSLAVSTARGFEVLTLDRKQPASVPDLKPEHVQNIARHLKDQKALCMLRISDQEFLLCYDNCAVYINKHGDVSRSVIMEFVGTAQSVAMYGAYIILFDNDFVEIRNAQNGRLKQIIAGKEIKCLDDGGCWTAGNSSAANGAAHSVANQRTVKFVMQHPEMEKMQIVVELILNEGTKE